MATALPLTIPAGQSLSGSLSIAHGLKLTRIGMPEAWDAAPLTFQISPDNVTWWDLYHAAEGTSGLWAPYETGVQSITPNSIVLLPPDAGLNLDWIKIRSGSKARPIVQTADRVFLVMFA